jgi:hypothetical protein
MRNFHPELFLGVAVGVHVSPCSRAIASNHVILSIAKDLRRCEMRFCAVNMRQEKWLSKPKASPFHTVSLIRRGRRSLLTCATADVPPAHRAQSLRAALRMTLDDQLREMVARFRHFRFLRYYKDRVY